jgi:hypothetical protein
MYFYITYYLNNVINYFIGNNVKEYKFYEYEIYNNHIELLMTHLSNNLNELFLIKIIMESYFDMIIDTEENIFNFIKKMIINKDNIHKDFIDRYLERLTTTNNVKPNFFDNYFFHNSMGEMDMDSKITNKMMRLIEWKNIKLKQ